MAILGIIAEFNPFHNGHKFLFDSVKKENDTLICVMSGNFVQRGDTAIFKKSVRAKQALLNGADIIIELPTPYSLSSASNFAYGAVSILKTAGVDTLCFGSECGEIKPLKEIAEISQTDIFKENLNSLIKSGITYPCAFEKAVNKVNAELSSVLKNPNDTLAVEYISACKKLGYNPDFKAVKRVGASHNGSLTYKNFASATYLREKILNNELPKIKKYIPDNTLDLYNNNFSDINNLQRAIPALLRQKDTDCFKRLPDLSEGIENRLLNAINNYGTYNEICEYIKTKRYPASRVRRLVINAFLSAENLYNYKQPPYLRILGFTRIGEKYIKKLAKDINNQILIRKSDILKLDTDAKKLFDFEEKAGDLYALSFENPLPKGYEATNKFIKI